MAEKCHCGKGLVEAVMTAPEGGDKVYPVCPIHGPDYVWRPCVFAGGPASEWYKGKVHARRCDLVPPRDKWPERDTLGVAHTDCATCPIPAKDELIAALVAVAEDVTEMCTDADRIHEYFHGVRESAIAALALLPQAPAAGLPGEQEGD